MPKKHCAVTYKEEIPDYPDSKNKGVIWLLTQQLTHALEQKGINGAAKIVADIFLPNGTRQSLGLSFIPNSRAKGWAQEAYAYNSLVIACRKY